jgi:hypothetical protein
LSVFNYWKYFKRYVYNFDSVLGFTAVAGHAMLVLSRFFTLFSSLIYSQTTEDILQGIERYDEFIKKAFKTNCRPRSKLVKYLGFITLVGTFVFAQFFLVIYYSLETSLYHMLTNVCTLHLIHVKAISFVFFVDIINNRLESLQALSCRNGFQVVQLHSKLFSISKLINDCYGRLVTAYIIQQCFGIIMNTFWYLTGFTHQQSNSGASIHYCESFYLIRVLL